ncbi:MAG: protein kinase [Actinobacteria bacterium]|nr:protein kinase [Actinomycetota bacterium]
MSSTVSTVRSPIRGRYEVLDIVGRGGQGTVMRAIDVVHQRHVALKVKALPQGEDWKAGLEEARVLFTVRPHPNLALLREDFVLEDRYYLVMDWIEGRNLRQVLTTEGTPGLPPERVLDYLKQAGEAVDHLHAHDPPVMHQDLKPSNFVLTSEGRVVLVDFGICSPARSNGSVARLTPDYAAPEVFTDGPSPSSDIFSLAATGYALLTGAPPRPGVPPEVAGTAGTAMIQRIRLGLAIDPARRPSSAAALVQSLQPGAGPLRFLGPGWTAGGEAPACSGSRPAGASGRRSSRLRASPCLPVGRPPGPRCSPAGGHAPPPLGRREPCELPPGLPLRLAGPAVPRSRRRHLRERARLRQVPSAAALHRRPGRLLLQPRHPRSPGGQARRHGLCRHGVPGGPGVPGKRPVAANVTGSHRDDIGKLQPLARKLLTLGGV